MGKGSFSKHLKQPAGKKAAAPDKPWELGGGAPSGDDAPSAGGGNHIVNASSKKEDAAAAVESGGSAPTKDDTHKGEPPSPSIPVVYDDVSVCRALQIHRRVIASARTKDTRGRDWDCVGLHAGMTMDWIQREALKRHIVPDFTNNPLKPIAPGDNIVSCMVVGTWPNRTRVTARLIATGKARIATVRNADDFRLYEIFDAIDYGSELAWRADLNNIKY